MEVYILIFVRRYLFSRSLIFVIILLLFEVSFIIYCIERDELVIIKYKGIKRVGRSLVRFLVDFDLVYKVVVDLIIKVFYIKCKCGEVFIRKGSCLL